jgi:hypothetical protein
MFHATIHPAAGRPLRLSGQVAPYDLQMLREHVLARKGRATRVEVRSPSAHRQAVARALQDLERRGVQVVLRP